MPQRAQRIRPCRAPGGNDGRDDHSTEDDRQSMREGDAVGRTDAEQHAPEKPADPERRNNTETGAKRPEPQASSQESANNAQA